MWRLPHGVGGVEAPVRRPRPRTIEKLDDPGPQQILGTHDDESILLNQLLKNFRSLPQMIF